MKIGITYDVKEEYGFEKLDLRFTDFLAMEEVSFIKESLEGLGHHVTLIGNVIALNEYLRKNTDLDLVFNMSWGYRGRNREGLIPAVLENYNIPYTGTDAYGCSSCLDKLHIKLLAQSFNIPTPDYFVVTKHNKYHYLKECPLSFPLIVKPNSQGEGMGVAKVDNCREYRIYIEKILNEYEDSVLCEEYIDGIDITVPLIEREGHLDTLGILEILDKNMQPLDIYDAETKMFGETIKRRASVPAKSEQRLSQYTKQIFAAIQGHDFGRADFKFSVQNGTPYFLEMAPLPSLAYHNSYISCAMEYGYTPKDVFKMIIDSALYRKNGK